ncbi:MAG TPA: hypothetical protein VJ772_06510 [Nitrososphaeraceae archaeon]|nr:hypothetical protein [Nitrososphaeraceae archaeon]
MRGYDKSGNRKWVAYALTCTNCGIIIRSQYYKQNLTKKQLEKEQDKELMTRHPALPDLRPIELKKIEKEIDRVHRMHVKKRKLRRIKYIKDFAESKMTRDEIIHRKNIRLMTKWYEDDITCYPALKSILRRIWDPKVVDEFLAVRPTFDEMVEVLWYHPLDRHSTKRANHMRGAIVKPDNYGRQMIWETGYRPHPKYPGTWSKNVDPNKIGMYEQLVIWEAEDRMELMQYIIKKHHESKIKVVTVPSLPSR